MERSHAGVQIRVPATANLMLDSTDRSLGATADNFVISKKNSILNGFFHRIAATEVVLDWGVPNISAALRNNTFTVSSGAPPKLDGISTFAAPSEVTVTIIDGFYTVETLLDQLVILLNASGVGGILFTVNNTNPAAIYLEGNSAFTINNSTLATQLNVSLAVSPEPVGYRIVNPDLRPYTYLDFVSSQLTYNQELKDATTAPSDKNVLLRWYFAFNDLGAVAVDAYGFPVLMGYTQFINRRTYSVPKQIRWNAAQPVGQLGFEIYGSNDRLVSDSVALTVTGSQFDWLMTLQVSEN